MSKCYQLNMNVNTVNGIYHDIQRATHASRPKILSISSWDDWHMQFDFIIKQVFRSSII